MFMCLSDTEERDYQRQFNEVIEWLRARTSDLEGVTKRFGSFVAVDDLTLTVPEGSFFALLGPSGCGKTTTLRMVAGLEDPTLGRVLIGDEDVTQLRPYKRPVNTVFQSYALFPHLTIGENVAFGLRRRGRQGLPAADRGHARAGPAQRLRATASPPSSPAASSSGSRSAAP